MFIRTKKGKIFDCVVHEQMGKPIYYPKTSETNGYIDWNEVYKKSENIIDILEVGDYVNGYKISGVYDDDGVVNEYNLKHKKCLGKNIYDEDYQEYLIYEEEIETIVTKEQFLQMEYKAEQ